MRYNHIPPSLFVKNREKIINDMHPDSIAIINSNDQMPRNGDQTYNFRQNSDLFYLTGIEQEKTILLLNRDAVEQKEKQVLFLLKPNKDLEIWEGHKLTKEEARKISGIENVKWLDDFEFVLREKVLSNEIIYLNINEYSKYFTDVPYRDIRFINDIKTKFPLHQYKRLAPILTKSRLVKEPEEIELMKKACKITNDAFRRVLRFVKPGVKEYEIEAELTHEFLMQGAGGHAYQPIVASGKNNCVLHYISNDQICKDGDLVLMDFGAEYAGYSADTTRTIPVSGTFSPRQKEVYEAVLRVLKRAIKLIIPGETINKVNKQVDKLIEKELIGLGLAKDSDIKDDKKKDSIRMKYFMHGTSHFMGLDVHDVGTKETVFLPGMVMSCEPAIYIAEEGIGIRLENDILVTADGQLDLLANEPIEIEDIERLMKKF